MARIAETLHCKPLAAAIDDGMVHLSVSVSGYVDRDGYRWEIVDETKPLKVKAKKGEIPTDEIIEQAKRMDGALGGVALDAALRAKFLANREASAIEAEVAKHAENELNATDEVTDGFEPICYSRGVSGSGDTCPECGEGVLILIDLETEQVACKVCGWFCYE